MQNIFLSGQQPEDYAEKDGKGKYPDAPTKCPHKGCGINLEMKKNGYYSRFLITLTFAGKIWIRRYVCPKCGKTLSMLPSFCIAGHTYGIDFILGLLQEVIRVGSIKKAVFDWQSRAGGLSRRHAGKYMARLRGNRRMIQYGINQISPGAIDLGRPPGDSEWTEGFLSWIRPNLLPEFNADFHKATGKSFMSLNNKIA